MEETINRTFQAWVWEELNVSYSIVINETNAISTGYILKKDLWNNHGSFD